MKMRTDKLLSFIFGLICLILTILGLYYFFTTVKVSFRRSGFEALFIFFAIPAVVVINTIVARISDWLLGSQKKFFSAVILPSFLIPIVLAAVFTLYLFFLGFVSLILLRYFLIIYFVFFLIVTIPQLVAYVILKEKTSGVRIVISVVLGCFIVFLYSYL